MLKSRSAMAKLKEADLRAQVIMPLMVKMGFRGVHEWHAAVQEVGKDIVAWQEDNFGNRINTAVVAKSGPLSSRTAKDVTRQIRQAFNSPFLDPVTLEEMNVHNVWVVTNGAIPSDSIPGIVGDIDLVHRRHVTFVDGDELWSKWTHFFPVSTSQAIDEAGARLAEIDSPYEVRVTLSPHGKQLTIGERYPGQLKDEPIEFKARFEVPDTLEGRRTMEQIEGMFKRGTPLDLPPGHFSFELPEIFRRISTEILGEIPDSPGAVQITSVPGTRTFPIRIEIENSEGVRAEFPYIELRSIQSGSEEITLTNDSQSYPIRVTQVVNFGEKTFGFQFERKDEPIAAPILFNFVVAMKLLAEPSSVRITDPSSGALLANQKTLQPPKARLDQHYFDFVSLMAKVQEKTNTQIFIPHRDLTAQEIEAIDLLAQISINPLIEGTWNQFSLGALVKNGDEEGLLSELKEVESKVFRIEIPEETVQLFGAEIPLGRVRKKIENPRLINESEVRSLLAGAEEPIRVELRFVHGENNRMSIEYLDWSS